MTAWFTSTAVENFWPARCLLRGPKMEVTGPRTATQTCDVLARYVSEVMDHHPWSSYLTPSLQFILCCCAESMWLRRGTQNTCSCRSWITVEKPELKIICFKIICISFLTLREFGQSHKASGTFVKVVHVSVSLSVCPHVSHWKEFPTILYCGFLLNSVEKFRFG